MKETSPSFFFTSLRTAYSALADPSIRKGAHIMAEESVYKTIMLTGTSTESWEKAAATAVEAASQSLQDLRVAEVSELDMKIENGNVTAYRAKIKISFKYKQA
jgi:flavin-binding protein dodecin